MVYMEWVDNVGLITHWSLWLLLINSNFFEILFFYNRVPIGQISRHVVPERQLYLTIVDCTVRLEGQFKFGQRTKNI